ncbi:hypothetical protein DESC_240074 [Desulfosarcina cetonica]|uniref:hypothetical protein n=1 Tax=Desulfosarcina cetonica TaxID=90730 RepID=UPI0006D1904A|nr:hypothetical protein [Desulfosarcina cetonica]VTR64683.1 hypothetical protein DESC_240074 [Desulfosarcina cetonica]
MSNPSSTEIIELYKDRVNEAASQLQALDGFVLDAMESGTTERGWYMIADMARAGIKNVRAHLFTITEEVESLRERSKKDYYHE